MKTECIIPFGDDDIRFTPEMNSDTVKIEFSLFFLSNLFINSTEYPNEHIRKIFVFNLMDTIRKRVEADSLKKIWELYWFGSESDLQSNIQQIHLKVINE